jgi:hypothetical protein
VLTCSQSHCREWSDYRAITWTLRLDRKIQLDEAQHSARWDHRATPFSASALGIFGRVWVSALE